jgi:hypothetical protein
MSPISRPQATRLRALPWSIGPELRMNGFIIDNDADPAMLPSFGVRLGLRL